MINVHKTDIRKLERGLYALNDAVARMGKLSYTKKLIPIIRRPGWTTPAELALVLGIVDSMLAHAKVFDQLGSALVNGSKAVVTKRQ